MLFKTANLTTEEILSMMNEYVLPRVKEEVAVAETKGAAGGAGGKGKGKKGKKW